MKSFDAATQKTVAFGQSFYSDATRQNDESVNVTTTAMHKKNYQPRKKIMESEFPDEDVAIDEEAKWTVEEEK